MKRFFIFFTLSFFLALLLGGQGVNGPTNQETVSRGEMVSKGNLFSAILFGNTLLGRRWAALRPEAEKLFPALKLKFVSDLHVTIIYIGKEWKAENLPLLRQAMAVSITDMVHLIPEIAIIGRNNQVVVVDLKGLPEALQTRIFAVKAALNKAGLKKPERYDASFRPHVTLAEAKSSPPTEQQTLELKAFQAWIACRLDLPTLNVVLDSSMPIQLLLAEATRPAPFPEYITVESFLENYR